MGQVLPFDRHPNAFDPETLNVIGAAYELAIASLHDKGQPQTVRELIADRIVTAARDGERDIRRLCEEALRGISR